MVVSLGASREFVACRRGDADANDVGAPHGEGLLLGGGTRSSTPAEARTSWSPNSCSRRSPMRSTWLSGWRSSCCDVRGLGSFRGLSLVGFVVVRAPRFSLMCRGGDYRGVRGVCACVCGTSSSRPAEARTSCRPTSYSRRSPMRSTWMSGCRSSCCGWCGRRKDRGSVICKGGGDRRCTVWRGRGEEGCVWGGGV